MVATSFAPQTDFAPTVRPAATPAKRVAKPISWLNFQKTYLEREDGYKYEWVNKQVVKSSHMDFTQLFILRNLQKLFDLLKANSRVNGLLAPETDIFFGENHRRPDVSYFTDAQIDRTAQGENQVPRFIVEVISKNDQMNLAHEKMQDYRATGVEVVWHIFPKISEVHVYSGAELKDMKVCQKEDICSAAPVLPDFEMTAAAIFQKTV